MRVVTLNVNGLRSADAKGFYPWLFRQKADLVCLQETRIQAERLTPRMRRPGRLGAWYLHAAKPGYSGVALYAAHEPDRLFTGIGLSEADAEGRVLRADFGSLSVVSLYMPSGSSSERRQAFKYRFLDALLPWLRGLREAGRTVLVCGDWNIAHRPIDLENWRSNQRNSGFLPEERAWMDRLLGPEGWRDVHRELAPDAGGPAYTWWSNRGRAWEKNVGWRIDYQIATPDLAARARGWLVYKRRRFSDHAPLVVDYEWDW